MSDYARIGLSLEVSENSDYSDPFIRPTIPAFTLTPDECEWRVVEATTSGATVELGMYTTIYGIALILDSTTSGEDVCAIYTNVGGHVGTAASTSVDLQVSGLKCALLPDVSPSADLVLDSQSGTPRVYVGIFGT